jgi:hypothetical protein
VAELVRDDVRLEDTGVLEDGDVAGQDVAGSQRGREGEPHEGEAPHFRARPHALSGDARDVLGEMPLGPDRHFAPRRALVHELVVEARGESGHLVLADLARHRHEVARVGAELPPERDLADAPTVAPIPQRAPQVEAERGGLHDAPQGRGAEEDAGH